MKFLEGVGHIFGGAGLPMLPRWYDPWRMSELPEFKPKPGHSMEGLLGVPDLGVPNP